MKTIFFSLFILLALCFSITAQTAEKARPKDALTIVNLEGKSFDFTAADFAKPTRQKLKAKDHDGKEVEYEGVVLADMLKLAGVKVGDRQIRGKRLAEFLVVEAKDGYKAVFSLTEFDPDFTDSVILLADKVDGKMLNEEHGYWHMIVPNQKRHGRWVRQIVKMTVKTD